MQADTQRHRTGCSFYIRRTLFIPGKIALGVGKGLPVPVNGVAKVRLPVDVIAHVLHQGQFYFHKRSIITVSTVAHHTGRLQMGAFKRIAFPAIDGNTVNAEERSPRQGIRHIRAYKKGFPVFPGSIFLFKSVIYNKEIAFLYAGVRFLFFCKARRRQDFHPRFRRVQVLVHH